MSSLTDIRGIGPALSRAIEALGITGPEALAKAAPDALVQVRGISPGRAQGFIDAARDLTQTHPQAADPAATPAKPAKGTGKTKPAKSPGKKDGTAKATKAGKEKAGARDKKAGDKKAGKKAATKKDGKKKKSKKKTRAAEKKADKKKSGKTAGSADKKTGKKKSKSKKKTS